MHAAAAIWAIRPAVAGAALRILIEESASVRLWIPEARLHRAEAGFIRCHNIRGSHRLLHLTPLTRASKSTSPTSSTRKGIC